MTLLDEPSKPLHELRKPCSGCDSTSGYIESKGTQDVVRCSSCERFQYNAPRTETGKRKRSVSTVHAAIKPKIRARILLRANGHCELCGASGELHVGHLLSVKRGLAEGMTEAELNSDENLCAMCPECNLGLGKEPVPIRFAVAILMARLRRDQ